MTTDDLIARAEEVHAIAVQAGQRRELHVITLVVAADGSYRVVYPAIGINTVIGVLARAVTQLSLTTGNATTETPPAPSPSADAAPS